MGQTAVQSSPAQASKPIAPTRNNTAFAIISRLAIALALFFYFHLDTLVPTLPRLEPIVYPSEPGQDIVYGWRLSIPVHRRGQAATELLLELGKIPDDRLKGRVIDSYAGLADNWLYFRVGDTEQTHVLLASLFLANLISREDAEGVLSKGPLGGGLDLNATLTRLPSLATLTAAYYAGAHVGTRIILGRITIDSKTAPVLVGGGAVAGAAVLFSRSSRQSAGAETPAGDNALVPMSLALNLLSGGAPSRGLNLAGARVLSSQEMRLPDAPYHVDPSAFRSFASDPSQWSSSDRWLDDTLVQLHTPLK